MDSDELKRLVLAADRQTLCDKLAGLVEEQRTGLLADAINIYRTVEKGTGPGKAQSEPTGLENEEWFDASFLNQLRAATYPDWRLPRWTGSLMLLWLSDEKFIKNPYKLDCGWIGSDLRDMPQRVLQVLDARRPTWLQAFAKRDVKEEFPTISWTVEYGLIRRGVLPTNDSVDFYRRMSLAPLMSEHFNSDAVKHDSLPPRPSTLVDFLRADPHLIETEIWKLLEYDAGAFNYSHSPWFEAFVTLSGAGEIDRARLLEQSAKAMSGNARPKELAGYGKLHESLEPTLEEREGVVEHYLAALHAEHATTVSAALAALEKLLKGKRLSGNQFLSHCGDAIRLAQKSPVVKTIRMIRGLVKQEYAIASNATEILAIAVAHERADVQDAALKELELLHKNLTELTRERLRDAEPVVARVHAARLAELLETSTDASGDTPVAESSIEKAQKDETRVRAKAAVKKRDSAAFAGKEAAALQKRIRTLPQGIRDATGVERAFDALESGTTPFVAVIQPGHVPRRDPSQAVRPIESLEELVDTVATVIEAVDDAMEIERVLDGIATFGRERPKDFEKRVAPIRKRIKKLDDPYSRNVVDLGAQIGLSQLLANWLDMEPIRRDFDSWSDLDGMLFRQRCGEIAEDWRMQREPAPLLSLPTHQGGWLDPEVLVERIQRHYLQVQRVTNDTDVALALLRLTPDGRQEALAALKQAPGDRSKHQIYGGGSELPFALGEGAEPRGEPHHSWDARRYAAALHSRLLVESDDFQKPFPIASAITNNDFTVQVAGPFCDDPSLPERLCVFAHSRRNKGLPSARRTEWVNQLEAMVWPANPRPMLMLGFLEGVFDPDFSWSPEAARGIMYAACVESKELWQLATDALIQSIAEARVSPQLLGAHMAGLGEHLTLKRIAEVLANVGEVSSLHQSLVFLILDEFFSHQQSVSRDFHFLLTPMLEAALVSGQTVSAKTCALLQSIKGSSKTAKLSRQLLKVEPDPVKQLDARIQALSASIERAERWHALSR